MTQHEALINLFRQNGNCLTLSQLMQPPLGREHSARMSDLRKRGYKFVCHFAGRAGENWYTMEEPPKVESNGQVLMGIAA
jgi:hypothetical protein